MIPDIYFSAWKIPFPQYQLRRLLCRVYRAITPSWTAWRSTAKASWCREPITEPCTFGTGGLATTSRSCRHLYNLVSWEVLSYNKSYFSCTSPAILASSNNHSKSCASFKRKTYCALIYFIHTKCYYFVIIFLFNSCFSNLIYIKTVLHNCLPQSWNNDQFISPHVI